MKFVTVRDLLPYKGDFQNVRKRMNTLTNQDWKELQEDISIQGISFPKRTLYKAFETTNFGWVVMHPDSKTIDGLVPGKVIFKE